MIQFYSFCTFDVEDINPKSLAYQFNVATVQAIDLVSERFTSNTLFDDSTLNSCNIKWTILLEKQIQEGRDKN